MSGVSSGNEARSSQNSPTFYCSVPKGWTGKVGDVLKVSREIAANSLCAARYSQEGPSFYCSYTRGCGLSYVWEGTREFGGVGGVCDFKYR